MTSILSVMRTRIGIPGDCRSDRMHELSIAQSIVEIVGQYVTPGEQERVRAITVRIGAMAGVVPDSLEFCFNAIVHHTPLANAVMAMEHVPFVVACHSCNHAGETEPGIAICPRCGSTDTDVRSGTELQVVSIDVDESIGAS
jgi:hydrogenase nickel incorporation protein HypA/HybF